MKTLRGPFTDELSDLLHSMDIVFDDFHCSFDDVVHYRECWHKLRIVERGISKEEAKLYTRATVHKVSSLKQCAKEKEKLIRDMAFFLKNPPKKENLDGLLNLLESLLS